MKKLKVLTLYYFFFSFPLIALGHYTKDLNKNAFAQEAIINNTDSDSNKTLINALDKMTKDDCFAKETLKSINNISSLPNSKIKYSHTKSSIKSNIEIIKSFKIIGNKKVLSEGYINTNCSECKNEFLFMIKSIALIN
jgi:hypothetical protein